MHSQKWMAVCDGRCCCAWLGVYTTRVGEKSPSPATNVFPRPRSTTRDSVVVSPVHHGHAHNSAASESYTSCR